MSNIAIDPFEPWPHKPSGFWCKKIQGKRHYLDRDYKAAKRKLRKILDAIARGESNSRDWLEAPFCTLADEFLTDITIEQLDRPESLRTKRFK